jgi:hypothetical protein
MFPLMLFAVATPPAIVADDANANNPPETLKIDILVKQPEPECDQSDADEIIVCAEPVDNERYRLRPIANAGKFEKDESKAEFNISENATMAGETEHAEIGPGVPSNRLMIRLKTRF